MKLKVKVYSCYQHTYQRIYGNVIKYLYGNDYLTGDVQYEVIDISNNGTRSIQSQRSIRDKCTRALYIYEDDKLRHMVVTSNTNYDYDKQNESGEYNRFGEEGYHANTYFKQGLPKYINYYLEKKKENPDLELSFYLLDINTSIPHNLFNTLTWRELQTIGFKILNIEQIDFSQYERKTGSHIDIRNIKFSNFIKYINDIATISARNSGNRPSFLQCVEECVTDGQNNEIYNVLKYTYTFKTLTAQGYDALFRILCLKTLADVERHNIEFRIGKQYFGFAEPKLRIADELTGSIEETLRNFGISIHFPTNEEFMEERNRWEQAYSKHRANNDTRNQTLFRNNLYKKGVPIRCVICGKDNPRTLKAAHLWEVTDIKNANNDKIDTFISDNNLEGLIDQGSPHKNDIFFKKYCLTNSGDNGVWFCANHHDEFDNRYYTFTSTSGEVHILHFPTEADANNFRREFDRPNPAIPQEVMTKATKCFLKMRNIHFSI